MTEEKGECEMIMPAKDLPCIYPGRISVLEMMIKICI